MPPQKLWNKNFAIYFIATGFSSFGSTLTAVALGYLIYEKTNSTTGLAIGLAISAGTALLSPMAGALVDKYPIKPILVLGDLLRGLLLFLLIFAASSGYFHVGIVYAVNLVNSLMGLFYRPAIGKLMPRMVPKSELMRANGLMGSMYDTTGILGYLLGGTLVAFLGATPTIAIDAMTFLLMGLAFIAIHTGDASIRSNHTAAVSKDQGSWSVFQYMVSSGMVVCPLLIFLSSVYIAPFRIALPAQFDSRIFGTFFAIYTVGTLLAGLSVAYFNTRLYRRDLLIASVLSAPAFLYMAALSTDLTAYFAVALVLGFLNVLSSTIAYSSIQMLIKDNIRGRVFGIMGMIERGGMPIAYLALSQMIAVYPTARIYTVFSMLLFAASVGTALLIFRKNLLSPLPHKDPA